MPDRFLGYDHVKNINDNSFATPRTIRKHWQLITFLHGSSFMVKLDVAWPIPHFIQLIVLILFFIVSRLLWSDVIINVLLKLIQNTYFKTVNFLVPR